MLIARMFCLIGTQVHPVITCHPSYCVPYGRSFLVTCSTAHVLLCSRQRGGIDPWSAWSAAFAPFSTSNTQSHEPQRPALKAMGRFLGGRYPDGKGGVAFGSAPATDGATGARATRPTRRFSDIGGNPGVSLSDGSPVSHTTGSWRACRPCTSPRGRSCAPARPC